MNDESKITLQSQYRPWEMEPSESTPKTIATPAQDKLHPEIASLNIEISTLDDELEKSPSTQK